jgi:hypothetical protein
MRCKIRNPEGVVDVAPVLGARQPFQGCTMMVTPSGVGVAEPPSPPATGDDAFGVEHQTDRPFALRAGRPAMLVETNALE